MNGKFEEIFFRLDQLQGKLDKITSDVDFRLSTKNDTSSGGLPISKRDRSHEKDTYAYPKNTSDVDASGGDFEILGTIKNKRINKRKNIPNSTVEITKKKLIFTIKKIRK